MQPAHTEDLSAILEPICEAFERDWQQGRRPRIEDQVGSAPEAARPLLEAALIRIELERRCRRGEQPSIKEYRSRFPDWADAISGWLDEGRAAAKRAPDGSPPQEPDAELSPTRNEQLLPPQVVPRRLLGEYELLEPLAPGGMGEVYKARHRRLGKLVALKLLPDSSRDCREAVARFRREIQAVGGLKHPNVVEAHDAGEQSGILYLAMELVDGTDLHRLVQQRGPLPVGEACELARQAAVGLQYLHERGLVHRDVKPSNLMRATDGVVKVLDLGLARWRAGGAWERTVAGRCLGTADYLAPEQVQDAAAADVPADLYGLGGTLFYLLTGKAPFAHHEGMYAKLQAHRTEHPADVRERCPDVPAALAELVARLLAKRPEDRPGAAEVAAALVAFASDSPASPPVLAMSKLNASSRTPRSSTRRLTSGVLLIALLGLGTWAWLGRSVPTSQQPSPPEVGEQAGGARLIPNPLTVRLRVVRLVPEGANLRPVGELGKDVYRVRLNDRVEVEAVLSEQAYAYLLAFNPADKTGAYEQLVPKGDADWPPEKRDRVEPDTRLKLDDGVGLQAFAVVASRQPLPAYSAWRKQRPPLGWERMPATSGVVWIGGGEAVDGRYGPGFDRATEEVVGDKAVIRKLTKELRQMPNIEAVSVIGFAVDRPE